MAGTTRRNFSIISTKHCRVGRSSSSNDSQTKGEGIYNVVVIGAGTAGLVTAAGTARLGGRVALIERHKMGGDCLNFGCVPSKALISSARLIHNIRRAARLGMEKTGTGVCFQRRFSIACGASIGDRAKRFARPVLNHSAWMCFAGKQNLSRRTELKSTAKDCAQRTSSSPRVRAPTIPANRRHRACALFHERNNFR